MFETDLRLIEDYLPIEALAREHTSRKGHINTLHLWWARRPLMACRAAVYGALVPADRWVTEVNLKNPPANRAKAEAMKEGTKRGLNRKAAGDFVEALCKYPGEPHFIQKAQEHILDAHADRLTAELAEGRASRGGQMPAWVEEFEWPDDQDVVTRTDIEVGRAPRPRVLDMFAGGGAIPLEALRLGCEAYALELNPVAHIIELCTLVYPQKYGKPDPNARGMTGPGGKDGKPTWGGLAEEVRYWGNRVLEMVKAEIGDLYPIIPDPAYKGRMPKKPDGTFWKTTDRDDIPSGYLIPVAYFWTRTVRCKDPSCGATVPLVKQTWLCKKKARYVALRMIVPKGKKQVRFDVVESMTEKGLGFDPAAFSKAGNATCPFCGAVADSDYVMAEGCARRLGEQPMTIACKERTTREYQYLNIDELTDFLPDESVIQDKLKSLCDRSGLTVPDSLIDPTRPSPNARGMTAVTRYGLAKFSDLFSSRQTLFLMTFVNSIRAAQRELSPIYGDPDSAKAILAFLGVFVDRNALMNTNMARWRGDKAGRVEGVFGRHALTMIWDYPEMNPFGGLSNDAWGTFAGVPDVIQENASMPHGFVHRGSATSLPMESQSVDAVITDPPYYDNVPYADVSDFFYVWLKRAIGPQFEEHFATELSPKKGEATALSSRHGGNMTKATRAYEEMMGQSFAEAHRVLKAKGRMIVMYAHKTTLGWSTLVDALRQAGFVVTEAWPFDTEMSSRLLAIHSAALASSIFLVARKREAGAAVGNYEDDVQPELERIVRERVQTLWEMGITGADLVIAAVGAGLRAFTKYERVEYANGEEVPAKTFLAEVEGVVLDTMMEQIAGKVGRGVSAVDAPSRFYVLWRYVYKAAEIDAGEAIVFTYGQQVELDGRQGLSTGKDALLEKKKSKYRLCDYTERGKDDKLGLPEEDGQPAPLIDVLHRAVWLMENRPARLGEFLNEARPNREQLRLLAAALAGPALSGKSEEDTKRLIATTAPEQAALGKLLAHWKVLVPESLFDAAAT